ncbi:ADP-ribosylation factor-related protein 1 [Balamuthia mandrillaris]
MFSKRENYVLVVGLDNAGKTTLLERMKVMYGDKKEPLPPDRIAPTVGLNIGRFEIGQNRLIFWDLGGQVGLRSIWDKYYAETNGVIFVVDSAESNERLAEAQQVLEDVLQEEALHKDVPILVCMNKQDLSEAHNLQHLADLFTPILDEQGDPRKHHLQPICALQGEGIEEGIRWLVNNVRPSSRNLSAAVG